MEDKNYLISIIVPVYNVETYLPRCIDTLIGQTYPNVEIILLNDGSLDKSGKICQKYSMLDNRIKFIDKQNTGQADTRNIGVEVAKGNYILFVDSDDWIEKDTCEIALRLAIENDADIVTFGVKRVYENGRVCINHTKLKGNIAKKESIQALIYKVTQNGIYNYPVNKLFSKALFDDFKFPCGRIAEDQTLYKLFHKARKVFVCDRNLYNYYYNCNSTTGQGQYRPKLIKDRHILWLERLDFLKKHYPDLVDYQIAQILGVVYVSLIKLKDNVDYADFRKEIALFAEKNKKNERQLAQYDRKVKLHYYCYPLFWIYVKLFVK